MKKQKLKLIACYFIVLLILGQTILWLQIRHTVSTHKQQGQMLAQTTANQLKLVMLDQVEKTEILEAFLKSYGNKMMDDMLNSKDGSAYLSEFNCIAEELQDTDGIKALQLLPKGIVMYTYPYEPNKAAIGDDVLHRTSRIIDALKAMETGQMVVSGALELMQGGLALIARNPIYYEDGTFWGFSVVVLDLPDILIPFGLEGLKEQNYEYRLTVGSVEGEKEIASTMSQYNEDTVVGRIEMFGQTWTLALAPETGWYDMNSILLWVEIIILLAAVLATTIAHAQISSRGMKNALTQERQAREVAVHAYETAKIANASKSTFLSTMSHDIRTPMNAIVGLCMLIERDAGDKERVLNYAKKINISSQHLLDLINDILDMSKIESGKTSLNFQEFSIAEAIDEWNTMIRPRINAKKQEFIMDIQGIVHENLIGDKLRLNQIMINLLSNAIKYTPDNGKISLKVREQTKNSSTFSEFEFEIEDNGIGMTEEFLEHVYEPFARAIDGRIDKVQGTGLGLTITKNLIDLMGGSIQVNSVENKGTKFVVNIVFRLPKLKNNEKFFQKNDIQRILVIEPDNIISNSIISSLSETKLQIECFDDVDAAQNELNISNEKGYPFDIILIDWSIPNSKDIINKIRHNDANIPIFTLVEYDNKEIEICDINGVLTKPFFLSNFISAIEQFQKTKEVKSTYDNSLQGVNILVAEDNEINGEIIIELLQMCGAKCTLCVDGQQIVNTFEKSIPGSYDIIFMDIQMPIMDGLTATRKIRSSNHKDAKIIPIVAMTANAFAEDRKASEDAGMNGHVLKPVDLNILEKVVKELVKNPKS